MTWVGSGSAWIRNFCLDPDLDPELGKFKDGSGINHSGSTTLLNSYPFCLYFILYGYLFTCVDPYSEYGSGSIKLLNTDPIRIRIHNTV